MFSILALFRLFCSHGMDGGTHRGFESCRIHCAEHPLYHHLPVFQVLLSSSDTVLAIHYLLCSPRIRIIIDTVCSLAPQRPSPAMALKMTHQAVQAGPFLAPVRERQPLREHHEAFLSVQVVCSV